MKNAAQAIAFAIVGIFLGSLMAGMVGHWQSLPTEALEEEPVVLNPSQATSPGHCLWSIHLFGQLWSLLKTRWGFRCITPSRSTLTNGHARACRLRSNHDTARAKRGTVQRAWTTGGAPDAYFDVAPTEGNPGPHQVRQLRQPILQRWACNTVNDYGMSAAISQNGGNYDINISYRYKARERRFKHETLRRSCRQGLRGTPIRRASAWLQLLDGLADRWRHLQVQKLGNGLYSTACVSSTRQRNHGHRAHLCGSRWYQQSRRGRRLDGAIPSPWAAATRVHTIDSTMGPKMDIGVSGLSVSNNKALTPTSGATRSRCRPMSATPVTADYGDGGSLQFFYKNGATSTAIDSVAMPTLNQPRLAV